MSPSPSQTSDQNPCQAGTAQYELAPASQFPHPVLLELQGQEPGDLLQQVPLISKLAKG